MLDMSGGADDLPLGYLLYRVTNALRGEVTATVLEPLGLSFPQYICMRMLSRAPGRSNAEVARSIGVSPQAMNIVLRSLQERALVERPAAMAAGRSQPAQLTASGREMLARTDAGVRAAERRLMTDLTEQQRRDFRTILRTLGSD
jgi:DNA-binding MarR family transcriptional regulator